MGAARVSGLDDIPRFSVVRWGRRWSVEDVLEPFRAYERFGVESEAVALAERLNVAYAARRASRRAGPVQPALFDEGGVP